MYLSSHDGVGFHHLHASNFISIPILAHDFYPYIRTSTCKMLPLLACFAIRNSSDMMQVPLRDMRCVRAFRLMRCCYDINPCWACRCFCCFPSCTLPLDRSRCLFITNIHDPTPQMLPLIHPNSHSAFHNPTTASYPIFDLVGAMTPLYPMSVLLCE